jgi:transcriptional regulator with XRE-family HTH domain
MHHAIIIGTKEVRYMTIIGERIKARRKELQMSQRELAAKMGYTDHTTITRIEAGKVDPPQSRIAQFADALGTTPGHLMGWDAEPEELGGIAAEVLMNPDLLKLVQNYLAMGEADQYAMRLMGESLAAKTKKD